jgi:hypothetical protein
MKSGKKIETTSRPHGKLIELETGEITEII